MSLKGSEINNYSWNISAVLISPFRSSSCCQACFPTIVRPIRNLWKLSLKMFFNSQNWTAPSSSRCTFWECRRRWITFFETSYAERERVIPWFKVNPIPFIHRNALVFFGLLPALTVRFLKRTPGRTPFHPCAVLPRPASRTHPHPATPFQCPRSRTATLGEGAAATYLPLRWPDCSLSRLRAEEYDRPVTQSIATLEPSSRTIPTLDRTLVAR